MSTPPVIDGALTPEWRSPSSLLSSLWGYRSSDYAGTFLTEFCLVLSQIAIFKLAALFLGPQGFSEFAVVRRTATSVAPLLLLGLGVVLPRCIAFEQVRNEKQGAYFGAALQIVVPLVAVSVATLNFFRERAALLIFGTPGYSTYMTPLSFMFVGVCLHTLLYAFFRGQTTMRWANWLQVVNMAVVPPAAFAIFPTDSYRLLLAIGIGWCLVVVLALPLTPISLVMVFRRAEMKELIHLGVQRVPGDFIQMAIFTFPVLLVAHRQGVQSAGYLSFAISVLAMTGSVFTPISLVLLPKASRMIAAGKIDALRMHVFRVSWMCMGIAILMVVTIEGAASSIVTVYLGPKFSDILPYLRLVMLGALPFGFYCWLRGLVDAFHRKGVNTLNNAIAFLFFAAFSMLDFAFTGWWIVPTALVLSLTVLGMLTLREAKRILFR
jgi:O-antigen/teichoic acid export membrane protein